MKLFTCFTLALALLVSVSAEQQQQQQRVLRRVIKSTPTASQLGRIRQVTVRSAENGAVAEISSKEAANFGQRAANETAAAPIPQAASVKTKSGPATTTTTSTTPTPSSSTTSTTTPSPTTSVSPSRKPKASERQQASVQPEVELLSSAPSSWQTMTAVEAPAAMLIATGVRASEATADLASSSSNGDLQRASSATKGAYTSSSAESVGETFSRLRQQQTTRQQQSFFYPQPAKTSSKTSTATKTTHWYQPAPSTTARPAPLIQEEQQYEQQQSEQYVEQQAEYNAAPPGQAEPFAFDFNTRDSNGNGQYRKEESDKNGVVRGSYGYMDASGVYRHVEYVADQNGFRANIKSNEPGLMAETSQSGPNAETQPASIRLATSPSGRLTSSEEVGSSDTGNWSGELNNAEAAAASPPNFESIHKPERVRVARHFRN